MQYRTIKISLEEQITASTDVQHLPFQRRNQRAELLLAVIFHIAFGLHIHAKRIVAKQTIIFVFFHLSSML